MNRRTSSSRFRYSAALIALMLAPLVRADLGSSLMSRTSISATEPLSAERLEAAEAVIGDVRIDNQDVFDTQLPEESGAFYRALNALHIETREHVIRRQLLVEPGDRFLKRRIDESERLLRANAYLSEAVIVPVRNVDGVVDIDVVTKDTWSLTPSLSFSRRGGRNTGGLSVEDTNLFGWGTELEVGIKSGLERDEAFFEYLDSQLGASRRQLHVAAADTDDGNTWRFRLEQPFYSLDARTAGGIELHGYDLVDSQYVRGDVVGEIRHRSQQINAYAGWSGGYRDGHVRRLRLGIGFDEQRFNAIGDTIAPAPAHRRDVFPFLRFEWLQDHYETARNGDQMHVVEDRHLGTRVSAEVGFASALLGSESDALRLGFSAGKGFKLFEDDTLLLSADLQSRQTSAASDRFLLNARLRYFHPQSERRTLYGEFRVASGRWLDSDEQLTLGGESDLRGYPAYYLTGTERLLLTLEQRLYTDWYPFRLFRVGAVAFFDAGRVFGAIGDSDPGWLRDIGVGLRIGSPRSSKGRVLHIDLAYPLDGLSSERKLQLVIGTQKRF